MTIYSMPQIAEAIVPVRLMTSALVLARRLGEHTTRSQLLAITGDDQLMAQAIDMRLALLAMLLEVDPTIDLLTAQLDPGQIAAVLAALPVRVRDNSLDFSGDELVAGLRLAANPEGTA